MHSLDTCLPSTPNKLENSLRTPPPRAQVYLRMPTPEITTKEVLAEMLAQIPEDVGGEQGWAVDGCGGGSGVQGDLEVLQTLKHH